MLGNICLTAHQQNFTQLRIQRQERKDVSQLGDGGLIERRANVSLNSFYVFE